MKYNFYAIYSEEDNEYIGLCKEFPSLSWIEAADEDALYGIERLVNDVVKEMESSNENTK